MFINMKKIAYGLLIISLIIIITFISESYLVVNNEDFNNENIQIDNNLDDYNNPSKFEIIKNTEGKVNPINDDEDKVDYIENYLVAKFKQKIKNSLTNSNDISTIDSIVTSFIESKKIVNSEKINTLWGLIKGSSSDF